MNTFQTCLEILKEIYFIDDGTSQVFQHLCQVELKHPHYRSDQA